MSFHRETYHNVLAGRDATQDSAGVVRGKLRLAAAHADLVGVLLAGEGRGGKSGADLDALHGIDAHHRGGQFLVEFCIERRPQPAGTPLAVTSITAPQEDPAFTNAVEIVLVEFRRPWHPA